VVLWQEGGRKVAPTPSTPQKIGSCRKVVGSSFFCLKIFVVEKCEIWGKNPILEKF